MNKTLLASLLFCLGFILLISAQTNDKSTQALRTGLKTSTGNSQAAIIHTLGERRYRPAVAELAGLLRDPDSLVATSAARALGRIGGTAAIEALQLSLATATKPVRSAIADALLDCASQILADGNRTKARELYDQFNNSKENESIRTAAYAGLIRSAENERVLELVTAGLLDKDTAKQAAALRLVIEIYDPKATSTFTNLLSKVSQPMQIALLRALQHRGDAAAAPAVLVAAQNPEVTIRTTAIAVLETLGDSTVVALLATAATSQEEGEQKAARQSLTELRRGDVANAMIAQLATASPSVQVELVRALTARMDKSSAASLLDLAKSENASTRRVALRGLEQLADGSHLPALTTLLMQKATNEASRAEIQSVFEALSDRIPSGQKPDVTALADGLKATNVPIRIALLRASTLFADEQLREGFRTALKETNVLVRAAAERTLCLSRDAGMMPDLLELARTAPELKLRALALDGYVRLVNENRENFSVERRVQLLQSAYGLADRATEKRLILSSLATAPDREALEMVIQAFDDSEIKAEAQIAGLSIAKALLATEPVAATKLLRRLAGQHRDSDVVTQAQSVLKQFDSGWLYAGPYRREGLECTALFDTAFPPEGGDTNLVKWHRAPGSANLTRLGEVDLQSIIEGNHAVIYLRTRVFSPDAQSAVFEIGSDDGIKLWVNDRLIHANNAIRGLSPGSDRVKGKLRQGWNDLFAKVTQSTAGCGIILNIKTDSGSDIPALRFDPRGETLDDR